jgi:hypothetical protein
MIFVHGKKNFRDAERAPAKEKGLAVKLSLCDSPGSGERIRTSDLRVKSVFREKQLNYLLSQ